MAEGGKKWNAQDLYDPNMPVNGRTETGSRTSQSPSLPPNQPQCGHFGNVIGQEGRRNENPTESNIRAEGNHRIDFRVNGSTQPLDCQGNFNYWELTSLPSDVYEDRLESSTGYDQGPHAPGPPSLMSFQLPGNSAGNGGDDLRDTHRAAPAHPTRVQTRSEDNRTAICPPIHGPSGDRNDGNTSVSAGNNSQDNIRQLRGRTRSTVPTSSQPPSQQPVSVAYPNSSRDNNVKPGTCGEYLIRLSSYDFVIFGNPDLQEAVKKWADVGFYHTKVGDCVKCQYCHSATDFEPDLSESQIWDFHGANCHYKKQERQDRSQDSSSSESNSMEGRDASMESVLSQEGAVGGISMDRSRSPKVLSSSDEEMVEDPRLNYRKEADGNAFHGATGSSTHIAGIHYPPPVASFLSPVHGPSTQCPGGRESATDFTIGSNIPQETSHFQTPVFLPTQSFTDQMAGASSSTLLSTEKKRQYHAAVDSLVDMGCSRKKATEIVDRYGEVYGYDISNLTGYLPT